MKSKRLSHFKIIPNYIPPTRRPLKAAIYVRVSTHYQVDKDSLPFQKQDLENYARYVLNTDNFVIFEDAGYSAKNTDRPAYQEMMGRMRCGEFTHLLVWKLDRISRNLADFTDLWDELKDLGVTFISKMEQFDTSSAMGEAMLRIILVFAELERKLTAERVFSIMLSRAEKGLWNGARVPLGYDWDTDSNWIRINDTEAAVVRWIYDQYVRIGSALQVAWELNAHQMKTKRGGTWTSKTVCDILRNPIYIGIYRWNYRKGGRGDRKNIDEVVMVENAVPPIIDRAQWERVQEMMDENYKGARENRRWKHPHPLSGLICCGLCGRNYLASYSSRSHKHGYHPSYYRCGTYVRGGHCGNKPISGLAIEPFLLEYLKAYLTAVDLPGPEPFQLKFEQLLRPIGVHHIHLPEDDAFSQILAGAEASTKNEPSEDAQRRLEELMNEKRQLERALARLDDVYLMDEQPAMTKREYLTKRADLQLKLQRIDEGVSAVSSLTENRSGIDTKTISRFLILHQLMGEDIKIRETYPLFDKQVMQDFFASTIKKVILVDQKVTEIHFPGGIVHRLIYT